MSSLLASDRASVLDRASAVLTQACEQRLWAQSDGEVVDRVATALRVRAQADAVLLAVVGEVEARGLARTRGVRPRPGPGCTEPTTWTRPRPRCWSAPRSCYGPGSKRPAGDLSWGEVELDPASRPGLGCGAFGVDAFGESTPDQGQRPWVEGRAVPDHPAG